MTTNHTNPISIIIRTYNESEYIENLLIALKSQTLKDIEIILVDSESTDKTVEIAQKYCDRIINIKKSDFTFGYSLNKGIEQATHNHLVLISAHTIPCNKTYLEKLTKPLSDLSVAMVYGKQVGDVYSRFPEYQDLLRTFNDQPLILKAPNYFSHNANSSLRKTAWHAHKFNELLSGQEDVEWAKYWMERGLTVHYEPQAAIVHSHRETWAQIRHRFKREKKAMITIGVHKKLDLLPFIFGELYRAFDDFREWRSHKNFINPKRDILLYRWNKLLGSFSGSFFCK